jgi:GNAT superfamily N-acetyltransferase
MAKVSAGSTTDGAQAPRDVISILPATEADIPSILSLINELAEYEKLAHRVSATEETLRATLFGPRRYAETLIARYDGEVAGQAIFFHTYSTFMAKPGIYIEDIYVRVALRGKGIGKALLSAVAKIAHQRGCGRIEWSVLDWNQPAIDFYRSIGADAMDDWMMFRLDEAGIEKLAGESE